MGIFQLNHRQELNTLQVPSATATYQPIPHRDALEIVEDQFKRSGFSIQKESISIGQEGLVMAAKWQLEPEGFEAMPSHSPIAVVLNGNTRKHTLRVGFGLNCMVCTNGMFISEKSIKRKHTKNIYLDIPDMVYDMIQSSENWYSKFMGFLEELKDFEPRREYVNDMLVRSMEAGVIASSHIRKVLNIFSDPTYEEYGNDTLYTLHNAYTEVLRDTSTDMEIPRKTIKLNEMIDGIRNNFRSRKLRIQ